MAAHIGEITGREAPTCPWRAFYDPLVRQAIRLATLASEHVAMADLGDDPPAVLLDALHTYLVSRNATRAHFLEEDRKKNTPRGRR